MELKAGLRLRARKGTAELVVVRAPAGPVSISIDGEELVDASEASGDPSGSSSEPDILLGKRYFDDATTTEVLCTKPGAGVLAVNGEPMQLKQPKPLPSSD
jgi:hypothetical protein